jgi:hypothetical protein
MTMKAAYFDLESCDLERSRLSPRVRLAPSEVPHASDVVQNVPVYDVPVAGAVLGRARRGGGFWGNGDGCSWPLGRGPCPQVAYADTAPIDAGHGNLRRSSARERPKAAAGRPFRHRRRERPDLECASEALRGRPEVFALYFGNPAIAAVCEAWLGPGYQMTAQVNLVRPGGAAQTAHRDYHLGFQTAEDRALPRPCACAFALADASGRGRPLRHAG